jgi:hypothetical protein
MMNDDNERGKNESDVAFRERICFVTLHGDIHAHVLFSSQMVKWVVFSIIL